MLQLYFDMIPIKCFFDKHTSLFDSLCTILLRWTSFTLTWYNMSTACFNKHTNTHLYLIHYTILQQCINYTSSVVRFGWSSRIFWWICPKRQKSRGTSSINNQHIQTSIQSGVSSQTYQMWRRKVLAYHRPKNMRRWKTGPQFCKLERSFKNWRMVTFCQLLSPSHKLWQKIRVTWKHSWIGP